MIYYLSPEEKHYLAKAVKLYPDKPSKISYYLTIRTAIPDPENYSAYYSTLKKESVREGYSCILNYTNDLKFKSLIKTYKEKLKERDELLNKNPFLGHKTKNPYTFVEQSFIKDKNYIPSIHLKLPQKQNEARNIQKEDAPFSFRLVNSNVNPKSVFDSSSRRKHTKKYYLSKTEEEKKLDDYLDQLEEVTSINKNYKYLEEKGPNFKNQENTNVVYNAPDNKKFTFSEYLESSKFKYNFNNQMLYPLERALSMESPFILRQKLSAKEASLRIQSIFLSREPTNFNIYQKKSFLLGPFLQTVSEDVQEKISGLICKWQFQTVSESDNWRNDLNFLVNIIRLECEPYVFLENYEDEISKEESSNVKRIKTEMTDTEIFNENSEFHILSYIVINELYSFIRKGWFKNSNKSFNIQFLLFIFYKFYFGQK